MFEKFEFVFQISFPNIPKYISLGTVVTSVKEVKHGFKRPYSIALINLKLLGSKS